MPNTHISIVGGILVGLLASFVQSLGLTIQRKSHVLNQLLPPAQQRVEHRRPLWLLGFAIFISSNIFGSLVQIASLPVVILAPLGAVSLLWNAFFARLILGDVFSPWMILGTLLIAGGAVLIAVFGIVPEPTRSLEDLLELFSRPAFVAYFSLLGAVVVVCLVLTHIVDYSISRKLSPLPIPLTAPPTTSSTVLPAPPSGNPLALTTGVTETVTDAITNTERTPLLIDHKPKRTPSPSPSLKHQALSHDPKVRAIARTRLLIAISYASFSGIISGMCLLFAKSGVELLLLTLRGQNQFWRWQAWVLLLGLIVFALLQLWYLHKALILADPTLVCPSAFCFYNLSSIVNGLVYFNQFSLIPTVHLILVIVGIVILLGGVWVVSIQSGSGAEDAGAWSDDEEDISLIGEESDEDNIIDLDIESQSESGQLIDVHDNGTRGRESVRIGPVKMDRASKSESNVPTISTPSHDEDIETGLGFDFRRRPASTISQSARPPLAPDRDSLVPSTSNNSNDIPLSPSSLRTSARRRSTLDRHGHNSTHNHSYNRASTLIAPPQLGAGFQIGLSPVSPGFSILPRRRRVSALGMADVVVDAVAAQDESVKQKARERHRRRTVSEGDVRRRALAAERERLGLSGEEGLDSGEEDVASADGEEEINGRGDVQGKGKGRDDDMGRLGRSRWKWLRDTFVGRR